MDQPEVIDPPENEAALYAQRLGLVRAALEAQDEAGLKALLEPLHPADIADILEQIGRGERARFFGLLGDDLDADVLSELDESVREEIVATLPSAQVAEAVADALPHAVVAEAVEIAAVAAVEIAVDDDAAPTMVSNQPTCRISSTKTANRFPPNQATDCSNCIRMDMVFFVPQITTTIEFARIRLSPER